MKMNLRTLVILMAVASLSVGLARAGESKVKTLSDSQLAAIQGGFCPFEICESAPGTGVCQPIPDTQPALCKTIICRYQQYSVGPVDVFGCQFVAKSTCSQVNTYTQCILEFKFSICSYGDVPVCGDNVVPLCHVNPRNRGCFCAINDTETPCDWTSCVP